MPDDSSSCWRRRIPGYSAGNAGRRAPREIVRRVAAAVVAAVAGGGAVAVGGDVVVVVPVVVAGQLPVRQLRLQQSCGRGGLPRPLWAGPH